MFRKTLFCILLLIALSSQAFADSSAILYGAVTHNGQPLPGTLVTVVGEATYTSKTVMTNENGVYVIDKLKADEYIVRALAQPDGVYSPAEQNVFLENGKEKEVNFSMKKTSE